MNVKELYAFLNEKIPPSLSCDWDNDGLMCCADEEKEIQRVLIALDMTAEVIQKAIDEQYDLILSHHPLIFSPLKAVNPRDHIARRVISLIRADVAAMSFHTRLDAVEGGVNDILAADLGLLNAEPFGDNGEAIGRIGTLKEPMPLAEFAALVKKATGAEQVQFSDAGKAAFRVAVLGGSGSSDVKAAMRAGADTYVSGELKHSNLTDAPECGMNLVAAGHFYTENAVCERLKSLVLEAIPTATVTVIKSDPVQYI